MIQLVTAILYVRTVSIHIKFLTVKSSFLCFREKLPPRPPGQRSEPENNGGFPGFGFGNSGGFQVSFGIGAFPFGLFASTFNFNDGRPAPRKLYWTHCFS